MFFSNVKSIKKKLFNCTRCKYNVFLMRVIWKRKSLWNNEHFLDKQFKRKSYHLNSGLYNKLVRTFDNSEPVGLSLDTLS